MNFQILNPLRANRPEFVFSPSEAVNKLCQQGADHREAIEAVRLVSIDPCCSCRVKTFNNNELEIKEAP